MIADFYPKPLNGAQFRKMRDVIMGLAPFPVEEHVGENSISTENFGQESHILNGQLRNNMSYADAVKQ